MSLAVPYRRIPTSNEWPTVARSSILAEGLQFLAPKESESDSRHLHICGESGVGKSFLVKSLLCSFAERCPEAVILYLDIDESEFESTNLDKRLLALISHPANPTRNDPLNIPEDRCFAHYIKPGPFLLRLGKVTFQLIRAAAGFVPSVGRPLQTALPHEYPGSKIRSLAIAGKLWEFLIATAREVPVVVALDNIQFLPKSIQVEVDTHLATSEHGVRLITVERTPANKRDVWQFRCFRQYTQRIELSPFSKKDTSQLVEAILGQQTSKLPEVCDAIYRKSLGNPKQIWLQLHSIADGAQHIALSSQYNSYEDAILGLPNFDRLILQLVTLLIGGLRVDDLTSVLHLMTQTMPKSDIHQTIVDLVTMGFLILNGSASDRVKTEHELVRSTIRKTTSESDLLELRQSTILALAEHLDTIAPEGETERLTDRLIGLLSASEIRAKKKHLIRLITLIEQQSAQAQYHYLATLFFEPPVIDILDLLPESCLIRFFDAFQKTSQFDSGLIAADLVKKGCPDHPRFLALYAAKYLVQKFRYREAEQLLRGIETDPECEAILFNILLNRCNDEEARQMVSALPISPKLLDEHHCVILRNSAHLFPELEARTMIARAQAGFARLGLEFGVATTRNNRGVVELWACHLDVARNELNAAREAFQKLGSNEIYQPLNNLAVLEAVQDHLDEALSLIQMAKDTVSPTLGMDALMIRHNKLCIAILRKETTLEQVASESKLIYQASLKTRDERFQNALALFAAGIDKTMSGTSSIPVPQEFELQLRCRKATGMEVHIETIIDARTIELIFVLSPHWRY